MIITRHIAQLISSPTFVRLGTLGLTIALSVIWGSISPDGFAWGS
jgi:hypothetical protein